MITDSIARIDLSLISAEVFGLNSTLKPSQVTILFESALFI